VWKKLAFWALVAAAIATLIRVLRPKPDFAAPEGTAEWPPLDLPGAESVDSAGSNGAAGDAAGDSAADSDWVESDPDGSCPEGFPVKLKLASGIYHVPGGLSYERTKPDRCYTDAAAAERDGFRQSRR